jgi:hypothetical protein
MVGGVDAVFNLAAPRILLDYQPPCRDDDAPAAQVAVGVEHGRAEATLYVFGSAAVPAGAAPATVA